MKGNHPKTIGTKTLLKGLHDSASLHKALDQDDGVSFVSAVVHALLSVAHVIAETANIPGHNGAETAQELKWCH